MSSKLATAMDDIAAVWVALTPPAYRVGSYRRATNVEHIAHRAFYFTPPSSSEEVGFDGSTRLVRYQVEAIVRVDLTGRDLTTGAEAVADETSLLCGAVQCASSWSAGIRSVTVQGSRTEPTDTGDLALVIALAVQCEESDR